MSLISAGLGNRLTSLDWGALFTIGGLLSLLIVAAFLNRPSLLEEGALVLASPSTISIYLEGAVTREGELELPAPGCIKDLFNLGVIAPDADLSQLSLQAPLKAGERVVIPHQSLITVWVDGAVAHPRPYRLPAGSTLGQLLRQVELKEDAVLYALRKRMVLQDHQTVHIPHRQKKRAKGITPRKAAKAL